MITQILTPWVGDGSDENPNRPKLLDDYLEVVSYRDVTSQPSENIAPTPNLFVGEFTMDATTLAAIDADPNYLVLWSE